MALELGIVVGDAAMLSRALDLARNVDEAQLFLMDDGVRAATAAALRAAIDDGLDATVCAMDAEFHQIAAVPGGPRFGSQWDHAMMVRHAERVVGMTGGRIDDNAIADSRQLTADSRGSRTVAVRLTRNAAHHKISQALRSAVAYAGVEMAVVIVVEPPARALLASEEHPANVLRAMGTLRALGHRFVEVAAPNVRVPCDVEVSW
jgi:hypothetical protein